MIEGIQKERDQKSPPSTVASETTSLKPTAGRLRLEEIGVLVPERAQIAYLSACSTAENRVPDLQDEGLHSVSGFRMIGYPHVIGAL